MNRLMMCRPRYYTVDYEINPWMHVGDKPDSELAAAQWDSLYNKLVGLGFTIELVEPVKGLPDMVFTANAGFVCGSKFILSNFRHRERQGEASYFASWAEERGFDVVKLPDYAIFEGEGDLLTLYGDDGTLAGGYRFRSDIVSHNLISGIIRRRVVSLELSSEYFYHLDTCFCPLTGKEALYYPAAFDQYGLNALSAIYEELIPLGDDDARRFCANAVVRERDIVMNCCSKALKEELAARGFVLHETDLSEFIKSGGSAKCLVLKLG